MSASSARLSAESSPPAAWRAARATHHGVVELEADRQLLQRLEHQRVEVADGAEVEEPEHAVGVDEDVPGMGIGVVRAVVQDLVEEGRSAAAGESVGRRHRLTAATALLSRRPWCRRSPP